MYVFRSTRIQCYLLKFVMNVNNYMYTPRAVNVEEFYLVFLIPPGAIVC